MSHDIVDNRLVKLGGAFETTTGILMKGLSIAMHRSIAPTSKRL